MINFRMSLDPRSLAEIAQMFGFPVFLSDEVGAALDKGAQTIAEAAQANTWQVFEHPTGVLAGTIEAIQQSKYEAQVVVGSPYGRRREFGFSGRTDSLGRYFANDPGKPYLAPAFASNEGAVFTGVEIAVERALNRIGGL